jgi:hypothetical protein
MGARRHEYPMSHDMHNERMTSQQRPALSSNRVRAALLVAAVASAALMIPSSPAFASLIPGFSYNRPVEITNSSSGLRADVMWASTAAYTGVFLWPNNASRSQEFDALGTGGEYFRLRARHSGLCLALNAHEQPYRNGTPVIQRGCNPDLRSSYWRVRTVGDRVSCDGDTCTTTSAVYPTLQNLKTGRCLDARNSRGGRPPARAVLQQWSCIATADDWNSGNQRFSVRNVR